MAPAFDSASLSVPALAAALPRQRDLFYGGGWHSPTGEYAEVFSPGNGENLGPVAQASAVDVDAAIGAAHEGYRKWRLTTPFERTGYLRRLAEAMRAHAHELALIDAANCGNPLTPMLKDVYDGAQYVDFFAGLTTELKGVVTPMGPGVLNLTVPEPLGVCVRILAYNHPFMFLAIKLGAPIAAGNSVIIKPSPQAPLSALRFFEIAGDILPAGVLNLLTGGLECGQALVAHPRTASVSLVGSVPSGIAVAKVAAERLKHVGLELGGKNALIIYPDADLEKAIEGAVRGMNFLWCGQSCGSTSRLFIHDSVYDRVLDGVIAGVSRHKPGLPTDASTTMGALVSREQRDKVLRYIEIAKSEGATLAHGGGVPADPQLAGGFYVEPTIFTDVTPAMRIAREEVFGPVLCVLRWSNEDTLFAAVNDVDYGLTGSIWTTDLATAHRAASRIESGYIWVNGAGPHYLGAPFGGYKLSGVGREEYIGELFSFTQIKNIHITL